MNEWDKLWKEYEDQWYALSSGRAGWLMKIKAEGDLNLKEKRSLLTYGGMMRTENARLEQKLEAIVNYARTHPTEGLIHLLRHMELLGE